MILFIINCSKEKAKIPCLAKDMYKSKRFIDNLCRANKTHSECLILSGKYGLIKPSKKIAPYDINLNLSSLSHRKEIIKKIEITLKEFITENRIKEIHTDSKDSYYNAIKQSLDNINYSGKIKSI